MFNLEILKGDNDMIINIYSYEKISDLRSKQNVRCYNIKYNINKCIEECEQITENVASWIHSK